jgi:ketosteroid isomerase-like protein
VRAFVVAVLTLSAAASCDAVTPPDQVPSTAPSPPDEAAAPAFRFVVGARRIEATDPTRVGRRDRRRAQEILRAVRDRITDLYVAAFLDPERWETGDYDVVFALFAGGARAAARERAAALTAGPDAAARFTTIRRAGGRIVLRALVDRSGAATLVSSAVRFRARVEGDEPALLRSQATYLLRRTDGGWRIVAFEVVRRDRGLAA